MNSRWVITWLTLVISNLYPDRIGKKIRRHQKALANPNEFHVHCTCCWYENGIFFKLRKQTIISLIFKNFSCLVVQIPPLHLQQTTFNAVHSSFEYYLKQRFSGFAQVYVKKRLKKFLNNELLQKWQCICTLPYENLLRIKELMINFLSLNIFYFISMTCYNISSIQV